MPSVSVIAGEFKGRKLKLPDRDDLRPMSGKLREALFNSLMGKFEGKVFLDLFAGTGAVGIEALSRGAARIILVDRLTTDLKAVVDQLAIADRAEVVEMDSYDFLRQSSQNGLIFDMIFLDPPYAHDAMSQLESFSFSELLSDSGQLIYSHQSRSKPNSELPGLYLTRDKGFGESSLASYKKLAK
jgi:16S rRNA (guanine966-N2)-methyltransferase